MKRIILLLVLVSLSKCSLHRLRMKQEVEEGASGDFSYENGGTDWPGKCQSGTTATGPQH